MGPMMRRAARSGNEETKEECARRGAAAPAVQSYLRVVGAMKRLDLRASRTRKREVTQAAARAKAK